MELHFYCRATKKEQIEDFKIEKKMGHLGIPDLKGCGSFLFRNKRLRFIVMPKYGDDLQNVLEQKEKSEGNPNLSVEEASDIALQVIGNVKLLSISFSFSTLGGVLKIVYLQTKLALLTICKKI